MEVQTQFTNQIINAIKKKIIDEDWEPGYRIPSEEQLVKILEVSRGTVRKAISLLVEDGVLEKNSWSWNFCF